MKYIIATFVLCLVNSAVSTANASADPQTAKTQAAKPPAEGDCRTGDACGKIRSDDKQMIRIEQDRQKSKRVATTGTDRERWANPIYSDATRADDLQLLLVKPAGLTLRLAPKTGILYFEKPGQTHAFKIAAAAGDAKTMCPKYNFAVISASERHAVIKKDCPAFEWKPNRSAMSSKIILYDAQTATTKSIWYATAQKGEKFPYADPKPDVKLEKNGYSFRWTGIYPGQSSDVISLDNSYIVARDPGTGQHRLECRDLKLPKAEQTNSEVCQGLMLRARPANKQ